MSEHKHEKIHDTDEPVAPSDPVVAADEGDGGPIGIPVSGPPADPPPPDPHDGN